MQKISLDCNACGAKGTIRLTDESDDLQVEVCPVCGNALDLESDEEDE